MGVFCFIYSANLSWEDYFVILQRSRVHRKVTIYFYSDVFAAPFSQWSPWFKLLIYKYIPRAISHSDYSPQETIGSFIHELTIAARDGLMVEFNLIHNDSVLVNDCTETEALFVLYVLWKGEVSFDGILRVDNMLQSPFSYVFRHAPGWIDYNIPGLFGRNHINRILDRYDRMNEVGDLDDLDEFDPDEGNDTPDEFENSD